MAFICKLSLLVVLGFLILYSHQEPTAKRAGLNIVKLGPEQVKGLYKYDDLLGLQFDIRPGFMRMETLNATTISLYIKLTRDMEYFQIADRAFISQKNKHLSLVPEEIPKTLEALKRFAKQRFSDASGFADEDKEVSEAHKEALDHLRKLNETRLLQVSSKALAYKGGSGLQLEITQPYHLMSLNLLQALESSGTPVESVRDFESETKQVPGRAKRSCTDLSTDPYGNNCFGMCGKSCSCWSWVCGDCCYHQGCYEHDKCCENDWNSSYCQHPYFHSFSCNSYGGYSNC